MTEMTSTYDLTPYPGESEPRHHFSLIVDDEVISEMWIHPETGEIGNIETLRKHRGNGYARALYRIASAEVLVLHAPAAHRTFEGNAFAESVGGDSLPCLHGCCDGPDYDDED